MLPMIGPYLSLFHLFLLLMMFSLVILTQPANNLAVPHPIDPHHSPAQVDMGPGGSMEQHGTTGSLRHHGLRYCIWHLYRAHAGKYTHATVSYMDRIQGKTKNTHLCWYNVYVYIILYIYIYSLCLPSSSGCTLLYPKTIGDTRDMAAILLSVLSVFTSILPTLRVNLPTRRIHGYMARTLATCPCHRCGHRLFKQHPTSITSTSHWGEAGEASSSRHTPRFTETQAAWNRNLKWCSAATIIMCL